MARFLLWNVQKKRLDRLILDCADQEQADAVFLVEPPERTRSLDSEFRRRGLDSVASLERFRVYARSSLGLAPHAVAVPPIRANVYRWVGTSQLDGLLVLIHGHDRLHYADGVRSAHLRSVAAVVREAEGQLGHHRSIVLGDFNANPYDTAVVGANGLHAIGVRQLAGRTERTFISQSADFFYNPMWRLFGHGQDAGSATHYFHGYNDAEAIWHMLDQVVVRTDALDRFPESEVRILTRIGNVLLWDVNEVPDATTASDHLPLVFHWNL